MPEGGSPEAVPPPPPARASIRLEGVGGARLLASDLRTASIRLRAAFLLVNEARHTMLERLFGLEREQAKPAGGGRGADAGGVRV